MNNEYISSYLDKGDMTDDDKYTLRYALKVLLMTAKVEGYPEAEK